MLCLHIFLLFLSWNVLKRDDMFWKNILQIILSCIQPLVSKDYEININIIVYFNIKKKKNQINFKFVVNM